MPAVTIAFKYEEQEWTHKFDMDVNASILDLKRKMTSSAPEHAAWFELRKDGLAVKSSDSVDPQVIYNFEYLGPDAHEPAANSLTNGHSTEAVLHEEVVESPADSPAPAVPRWRITGGADKGGIIVRQSESLKSPELGRAAISASEKTRTQSFHPDDDEEPMVRRSTTLAEKRAIYSHTRALLAKIRFQRPLVDERPGDANDANGENDQETAGTLSQSAAQRWGNARSQYTRTSTNWKKLREFVRASKQVRKAQDVMQIWTQVHQENTQRKLLEALTEFMQSEALRVAEAAEAAELFRAAEAAAAAAAEARARKEAEDAARAAEREKREIFDIHAFSKQAANMMESLAQMQKEQDQLLREVEELQANMNLSSRRADRLVQKIQESDMADTVNAIRNLAAQIPESDEDEEEEDLEEEKQEEEVLEEPEAVDVEPVEPVEPVPEEKMVTFEEKREELIEKVVEIEWLLLKSRKMQNSQEVFAQEMKDSLCPLLPRMRPRCDFGHLMNEAPGRCPTAVRSEDACCSCGVIFGHGSKSQTSQASQALPSPSPGLTLPGALGDPKEAASAVPATHWVCQDCLFQSHVASWMCYDCSLEHQKTEMGRVAASLEAKAERSHEAELQAIVETIDPSIRAEAQRRLRLRRGSVLMEQVVEATPSEKRPQFVRKEKPKKKRVQVARRNSTKRLSLIMKHLDLGDKFLPETEKETKEDSPKERSPVQLAKAPSPEIGSEVTKITVEGVVLERALGIRPDKEIISSSQLRSRRNQLALEASEIAKRLAQNQSRELLSSGAMLGALPLLPLWDVAMAGHGLRSLLPLCREVRRCLLHCLETREEMHLEDFQCHFDLAELLASKALKLRRLFIGRREFDA
eukprot:s1684_g8.t2